METAVKKDARNAIIEIKNVFKYYDEKPVLKNVSLSIKEGEFVTLLGPSGCGKTTTLRLIAGFEEVTKGTIFLDGKDISRTPPHLRPLNTVFQRYALFPHLNVFNNIAFGLKLKKIPNGTRINARGVEVPRFRRLTRFEIKDKVNRLLKLVDLEDYGERSTSTLSGGQMQRVAIARALVNEPKVLLLDEPLGALDLKMRKDMQIELMNMHKKLGITFVYVTHDQEEALTMSDTIVVMKDGVIQQIGEPKKIYDEPANAFVADFIGESNIFSGTFVDDKVVEFCEHRFDCVDIGFQKGEPVDIIIRPEDFFVIKDTHQKAMVKGTVTSCVFKGDHYQTICYLDGAEHNELVVHDNVECDEGERIGIFIKPSDIHIMHKPRIINTFNGTVTAENTVNFCGVDFPCVTDLPVDTEVTVKIDFDDVIVEDHPESGILAGTVESSIYKGSYYQSVIRTDDYFDFFVDTEIVWLKGDRVGINVKPEKILVSKKEVTGG